MKRLVVAIDGPAGAGKSTVAKLVAVSLGYTYVDTGAMYRAVALLAAEAGVLPDDAERLTAIAGEAELSFAPGNGVQQVLVGQRDVTTDIRSAEATRLSSPVSAVPGVRRALVARQRALGADGGVVMEGRDIGTVVFPAAEVKVFLTASALERARRRCQELVARGVETTVDVVRAQIEERDSRDSSRADSPLRPADDAVMLDTDGLGVDQVVGAILALCHERGA